jgi:hypothetical protein
MYTPDAKNNVPVFPGTPSGAKFTPSVEYCIELPVPDPPIGVTTTTPSGKLHKVAAAELVKYRFNGAGLLTVIAGAVIVQPFASTTVMVHSPALKFEKVLEAWGPILTGPFSE